jgi:hypothetical protein
VVIGQSMSGMTSLIRVFFSSFAYGLRFRNFSYHPDMDGCRPRVVWVVGCERLAGVDYGWVSHMFRPSWAVTILVDVYKLCRVRNSFEWPCPRYRTCYSVDLTHVYSVVW